MCCPCDFIVGKMMLFYSKVQKVRSYPQIALEVLSDSDYRQYGRGLWAAADASPPIKTVSAGRFLPVPFFDLSGHFTLCING